MDAKGRKHFCMTSVAFTWSIFLLFLIVTHPLNADESLRSILKIDLTHAKPSSTVNAMLFGGNMSYFNDLDEVWDKYNLVTRYRNAGVSALRYPGGEETSRFHWEYSGVNGYVDLWNPESFKQKWMSTYVPPELWESNKKFIDFDDFVSHAKTIGAAGLIGINFSSGIITKRIDDAVNEAVRWIQYAKDKDYRIEYWYFDNEPWHKNKSNYIHIPTNEYARLCVQFADAMRKVDANAKFIANPVDGNDAANWEKLEPFLKIAGNHINMIDFHWYWEFGSASWERYLEFTPLRNTSSWTSDQTAKTYTQLIRQTRRILDQHDYKHIQIAALEWNVGPGCSTDIVLTSNQIALIQAEMLMQMIDADLDVSCIWPIFWQINQQNPTPYASRCWFEQSAPYKTTPAFDVFKLLSITRNGVKLDAPNIGTQQETPILVVQTSPKDVVLFALNKETRKQIISINPSVAATRITCQRMTVSKGLHSQQILHNPHQSLQIDLLPTSLTCVQFLH